MIHQIQLQTKSPEVMLDITSQVQEILVSNNVQEGLVVIYSSHTTAGIDL